MGKRRECRLTLIAAVAQNGVIGCDGRLPWHFPQDLRFFKRTTAGHPLIMGRKTRESFGKNPLPGRPHIVLSRNGDYSATGSSVVFDMAAALQAVAQLNALEAFVIGGAAVYAAALPYVNRALITRIPGDYAGDTFFPDLSAHPHIAVQHIALQDLH